MKAPHIKTALPGPKAKAIVERDHQVTAPAYGRVYPLVVKRAAGMVVEDVDGNLFLDFMAGIAVASTGHSHPRVVKAIEEQARKFLHICGSDYYYEPMVESGREAQPLGAGRGAQESLFHQLRHRDHRSCDQARALSHQASHIIAFHGAFHGRTLGALSLTASRASASRAFGPLIPGVHHVPYGFCHRCPYQSEVRFLRHRMRQCFGKGNFSPRGAARRSGGDFRRADSRRGRLRGAAAGIFADASGALPQVRHAVGGRRDSIRLRPHRQNVLACEHWGIEPDILCVAKGIASGMPLGAMIARAEISTWTASTHGSTFGGNPVACAAALATIRCLKRVWSRMPPRSARS